MKKIILFLSVFLAASVAFGQTSKQNNPTESTESLQFVADRYVASSTQTQVGGEIILPVGYYIIVDDNKLEINLPVFEQKAKDRTFMGTSNQELVQTEKLINFFSQDFERSEKTLKGKRIVTIKRIHGTTDIRSINFVIGEDGNSNVFVELNRKGQSYLGTTNFDFEKKVAKN